MNLKYQYDKVGRLTRVSDNGKNFTYKYDAAGKLVEELNGVTGIRSDYHYYPSGNIKSLRHFNGKDITSSYEYRYDARGNQIQKDEGNGTTKYFYDPLSRIKTAMLPDSIQNYEYDDLDNIKELTEIKGNKIEETSYQYDRDSRLLLQETQKGDENIQKRFTYDNVGNQLTKDEVVKRKGNFITSKNTTFDYNGFNQVERVKNPDGKYIEYIYNGNGLRTKKDFGDKAVNYYYDGGNIIMETDQGSRVTAKNIRGLRLISRENNPGQTNANLLYYLHNAHGDVTQLVDEKGQVIKDYRYDPFGNGENILGQAFSGKQSTELWRQEVEKIDNPFRYAGEYLDEETGNYYLRARYYDPSIQRFINEDSYGVERGASWSEHWYNYAGNNPIRFTDPTGHWKQGDEKYDKKTRDNLEHLTRAYNNATSDKERNRIGATADAIRKKGVIEKGKTTPKPAPKPTPKPAPKPVVGNQGNKSGTTKTDMWGNSYPIYGDDFDNPITTNVASCHTGGRPIVHDNYLVLKDTGEIILSYQIGFFGLKPAAAPVSNSSKIRTFKELLSDVRTNPKDWKKTGKVIVDSTKKGNKGGRSIEEVYVNQKTGEKIYKHILEDKYGKPIEQPHFRPFPKQ